MLKTGSGLVIREAACYTADFARQIPCHHGQDVAGVFPESGCGNRSFLSLLRCLCLHTNGRSVPWRGSPALGGAVFSLWTKPDVGTGFHCYDGKVARAVADESAIVIQKIHWFQQLEKGG